MGNRVLAIVLAVLAALAPARLADSAFDLVAPVPAIAEPLPSDLSGETIVLGSGKVAGWYVPGEAGKGAVLLLHGVRSNRASQLNKMRLLRRHGFGVLAIDQQAHGESPGDRITFGVDESQSALAAIRWLRERGPAQRIGVIGMSMGAASGVLAAREELVAALVIEAPFADIDTALSNRLAVYVGDLARPLAPFVLWLSSPVMAVNRAKLRLDHAIADVRVPLLVIAGDRDQRATPAEAQRIFDAAPGPKAIWIVPGAGHQDFSRFAPPEYEQKVVSFLARHLNRDEPGR